MGKDLKKVTELKISGVVPGGSVLQKRRNPFLSGSRISLLATLFLANKAFAASGSPQLEAAGKNITDLIVLLTVILATIGIFIGAIQIRKGLHSEGKQVILGSCVCLFIASSLYMIIALVSG